MNKSLKKLYKVAGKHEKKIIGLMSGTSLDGVDVALCSIKGQGDETCTSVAVFKTFPYPGHLVTTLKENAYRKDASLEEITILNAYIGRYFAEIVHIFAKNNGLNLEELDAIASHGQTLYHAPQRVHGIAGWPNATLQIGDGDHIARLTGIITISDFRQKLIAAGGEGAPLAGYAEQSLCRPLAEDALWVNIGGISNATVFTKKPNDKSNVITTDIGPGNTLIDQTVSRLFPGFAYDKDGKIASSGRVDDILLDKLLKHPFFSEEMPKSTGQETFNISYVREAVQASAPGITSENLIATLTELTAVAIAESVSVLKEAAGRPINRLLLSGGGIHNKILIERIKAYIPDKQVETTASVGINPDAKEALLFAVLANETLSGNMLTGPDGKPMSLGKISLPC